jgi:hypothetical protein
VAFLSRGKPCFRFILLPVKNIPTLRSFYSLPLSLSLNVAAGFSFIVAQAAAAPCARKVSRSGSLSALPKSPPGSRFPPCYASLPLRGRK